MKLITVLSATLIAAAAIGCDLSEDANAGQSIANRVVTGLQYIKDPRTGVCFAYYWGGAANGVPALATVPCDNIPPGLLNVAR